MKILELYTLHVLLRNNEWDYAREFIAISEVLDEERREAFLQALQSLQDESKEAERKERELQRRQDEQLQKDLDEARQRRAENEDFEQRRQDQERQRTLQGKEASEIDYGIESPLPNRAKSTRASTSKSARGSGTTAVPDPANSKAARAASSPSLVKRASAVATNVRHLIKGVALSLKTNPMSILRMLAFVVGLLAIIGRRDVRERIRRIMGSGFNKIRATAGMGVKVSYI